MAFLGQAYAGKVDEIKMADAASSNNTTHNWYRKGKISSEAINALLQLLSLPETPTHDASRALDAWLGSEGIAGGSISKREMLCIKVSDSEPRTQIEEVEDSEASSDSADELEPAQHKRVSRSTASVRPLR
ncbi:hypothetical protein CC86DRAFT_410311 [Ophiobolus disseminans]|uniref:Uncharacterized protein n=1 Tax=Ophiobolus disseminans TaxID=1469910 RepID=A0A6A6ZPN4_9PLEO|nr:hypothetical protein CC86DRAFT_410311 [Ophiobolus disseminans]